MILSIYVPRPGSASIIGRTVKDGSAIVADPSRIAGGRALCYFEGNLYGSTNLTRYAERLKAAGRLTMRYPTTARSAVPVDELIEVGAFDAARGKIVEITKPDVLEAWSGESIAEILKSA